MSFNSEILNNHFDVNRFLSGEVQIQELSQKRELHYTQPSRFRRALSTTWDVATAPLAIITGLFLKTISCLTHYLGLSTISRFCSLGGSHLFEPAARNIWALKFGGDILVPSINTHQLGTRDIYLQEDIPVSSLTDPLICEATPHSKIKDMLENVRKIRIKHDSAPNPDEIREKMKELARLTENTVEKRLIENQSLHFFNEGGSCQGMSLWFVYLYLKTKQFFKDPIEHACFVAQYFEGGAPKEAALLQTFFPKSDLGKIETFVPLKVLPRIDIEAKGAETFFEQIKAKVSALPIGIYKLGQKGHATVFIKISQELNLVFDPSIGLIKFDGKEGLSNFHHYLGTQSEIYFERIELQSGQHKSWLSTKFGCIAKLFSA